MKTCIFKGIDVCMDEGIKEIREQGITACSGTEHRSYVS